MEIGQYQPNESCGAHFINYDNGVKPEIADGVKVSGLIDCIHKVIIEKDAFTGHDVMILTGSHDPEKFGEGRKKASKGGSITIKEGAWIASRAIVLGPCIIGKHAVIGAGAVVTGDIPDYALAVGVPAKVVKFYEH